MISTFSTHFLHPLFNEDNNTENNSLTSTISCPVYGVHFNLCRSALQFSLEVGRYLPSLLPIFPQLAANWRLFIFVLFPVKSQQTYTLFNFALPLSKQKILFIYCASILCARQQEVKAFKIQYLTIFFAVAFINAIIVTAESIRRYKHLLPLFHQISEQG